MGALEDDDEKAAARGKTWRSDEEREMASKSVAKAAETADVNESCAGIGSVNETFGHQADAEVPFATFDKRSSAGDCSVPVVTTLGLDSLLDDCPDWKTAILDATVDLDNSMPGRASLTAHLFAEPLASAMAAGDVARDSARSEEKFGNSNPSSQLLQPDSGEAPLEDAFSVLLCQCLSAKVSTEDDCVLGGYFAVVDECLGRGATDDDCMVVMDQA
ncbi:uncharacterized protein LOC119402958 [Rhipicephalus sanguineus]|uniref:uncharacterized protein LOC119402958 n=1 Tax=Rhipicephalus sanguineus TaxID=34632 RepID=UPI0020C2327B|nr:uncharacterized protein LOC119402958 [Rhipicephalus sanguineus]